MRRIALAIAVLALAGCGGDNGESADTEAAGGATKTIELTATDFAFDPDTIRIPEAGTYTFRLRNDGKSEHALEIEGQGVEEETETIDPGQTAELTVELDEGDYEFYCPVDGHKDLGMEGDLIVGGAGGTTDEGQTGTVGTGEDETETEDETGTGY